MFRRTLLQQTRQFSSLRSPVVLPAVRQWQVAPSFSRARRAMSATADPNSKPTESEGKSGQKPAGNGNGSGNGNGNGKGNGNGASTSPVDVEALRKELEKKAEEARDFKDKFTRTVADFRNLQDRTERDKKAARDFAIQKFAKDLVESVDNFDRALGAVPEEHRADAERNKELVDLYNGLKMTEEILLNTLKKHGLEKIEPLGEMFDPNRHEAMFQVPVEGKEKGMVHYVQQTGFVLNGRTIRAAKVGIVSGP